MKKNIPYAKLGKRERRALNLSRRRDWGELSPVTRRSENPKAYRRTKIRREETPPDFFAAALHFAKVNQNSI